MSKPRDLSTVPDAAETPTEPETFTFEDVLMDNGRIVRRLVDEYQLEDQAAVNLFAVSLQGHMTSQQLRQMREDSVNGS